MKYPRVLFCNKCAIMLAERYSAGKGTSDVLSGVVILESYSAIGVKYIYVQHFTCKISPQYL